MKTLLYPALAGLALLWGDWTSGEDVAKQAKVVAERAEALGGLVRADANFSHLEEDARDLGRRAGRFRLSVERGAGYADALRDFAQLQRAYSQLEVAFTRALDARPASGESARAGWDRLSAAFGALQREMGVAHAEWHPPRHGRHP